MNILYMIAMVILVIWILGVVFKIAGGLIHLLLLVALVLVVMRFFKGRRNS